MCSWEAELAAAGRRSFFIREEKVVSFFTGRWYQSSPSLKIRLLSKFSQEEIQVIEENETYLSIQQYLEKELASVEDGSAEYTTIEDLENRLDATIRKNFSSI
jgi:hypothetical protein